MPNVVDFVNVSTAGLESSPVAAALAGLRANEARYFTNKQTEVRGLPVVVYGRGVSAALA